MKPILPVTLALFALAACSPSTPSQPKSSSAPASTAPATSASAAASTQPSTSASSAATSTDSPYGTGTATFDGATKPWNIEPSTKTNEIDATATVLGGKPGISGLTVTFKGAAPLTPGFKLTDLTELSVTYGGATALWSHTYAAGAFDGWTLSNTSTRIVGTFDGTLDQKIGGSTPKAMKLTFDLPYPKN